MNNLGAKDLFFGIVATHPICSTTNNTSSTKKLFTISYIWFSSAWKKVSSYAVRFSCIDCGWRITSKHIYPLCNKFQVLWITARLVFTNVVKNWNSFATFCTGNFVNSCHNESMDAVGVSFVSEKTVTKSVFGVSPIPAFGNWVNKHLREKPLSVFFGEKYFNVFHYKIVVHWN